MPKTFCKTCGKRITGKGASRRVRCDFCTMLEYERIMKTKVGEIK